MTLFPDTARLQFRPFTEDDADTLYALHSDPEVMHYVGLGIRTKEQVQQQLSNITHQQKYGYSAYMVHERETGVFVGRVGLVHMGTLITMQSDDTSDQPVELGYILSRDAWGKGYATEASFAWLDWGCRYLKNVLIEGREGMYFSVSREEYTVHSKEKMQLNQE